MRAAAPASSWPGLSRPSTSLLRDCRIKVVPVRIHGDDLPNLPRPRPMLDVMFALDGISDVVELLEIDQPLQAVPFSKAVDESRAMFEYPADKITCHSDMQDAVRTIGQNIDVSTCHTEILQDVGGRDKPGHDELRELA